jgi:hypothetical protein
VRALLTSFAAVLGGACLYDVPDLVQTTPDGGARQSDSAEGDATTTATSAEAGPGDGGRSCSLPAYGTLTDGQKVLGYSSATVPCGQTCTSSSTSCSDGTIVGTATYYPTCSVQPCPCHFAYGLGDTTLNADASCHATLRNVSATEACTGVPGDGTYYQFYDCTFSCDTTGNLTRSTGAPCQIGTAMCQGSVVDGGQSNCPPP